MVNPNNWIDRLYDVLGDRTQKEFAKWLGVSPTKINNYFSGMVDYPSGQFLVRLAEKGINIHWLLTGSGSMFIKELSQPLQPEIQQLLHEVDGHPALAVKLASIARLIKEGANFEEKLRNEIALLNMLIEPSKAKRGRK